MIVLFCAQRRFPQTICFSFRYAEQKAKEIAAKREQAREQRMRDWDPVSVLNLIMLSLDVHGLAVKLL